MKNIKYLILGVLLAVVYHAHAQTVTARYVRIQQNLGSELINLAEIRAIQAGTGTNVALNKTVTAPSGPVGTYVAANLVDGMTDNFAESQTAGTSAFYEIDLGAEYSLSQIEIVTRGDCCQSRSSNLQLILKNGAATIVNSRQINAYQNQNTGYQTVWTYPVDKAALNFDGTNDWLDCGTGSSLEIASGTIEGWVKTAGGGNVNQVLFTKYNSYQILLLNGILHVYDTQNDGLYNTNRNITDNNWHHIAVVFTSGTNNSKVYLDGTLLLSFTLSSPLLAQQILSLSASNPAQAFRGSMDEVRIWNGIRTAEQIAASRSCEFSGPVTNLRAYYKFNEVTGAILLTDYSGNNNHGILKNFALSGTTSNWLSAGMPGSGTSCVTASINGPATGCGSATLIASGGASYLWSTGATTASIVVQNSETYTVTVSSADGSQSATTSKVVTIFQDLPTATISGNATGCNQVTLSASTAAAYAWSNGASTKEATFTETGAYTVTITDANGCTAVDTQQVTINEPEVSITGDGSGCDKVTLSATPGGIAYAWTGGALTQTATFTQSGTYSVTVTAANGCSAVAMHTIFLVDKSKIYYPDADGDGYGNSNQPTPSCSVIPGYILLGGDCDDANPDVNPGSEEICDNIDNNCNGILIEGNCGDASAQVSPACSSRSTIEVLKGKVFFNYGSLSNARSAAQRSSLTLGQPVVGVVIGETQNMGFGFWTRYLLSPSAPVVTATEGDLPDRVQIYWSTDPLSPASNTYKIYRNGALLATVDNETFAFIDFNVLAGQIYTYEVAGVNQFGEGSRGNSLGFLNPNGVVTGQVKTFSGNPVVGAVVKLSPTLGNAVAFNGVSTVFAEYTPVFPRNKFTLSCWVKQGEENNGAGIFDLGSSLNKNWWLHTLPTSSGGKGVKFAIGNGVAGTTQISYQYPIATQNDWHYVAASYNGSSLLLYVDGELVGTAVGNIQADSVALFIGKHSDEKGYFTGKIDELRFFDRQLPQTEIQMIMNQTVAANTPGLVAYWKFDEGTGSKGFDLSSNKIKAYFCGAEWTTDKPQVVNAGISDATGFYRIEGVNYSAGTTFTATPYKDFHFNQSLEFNAANQTYAKLTNFDIPDSSTIELTVKNFDFSATQTLLSKQDGSSTHLAVNLIGGNVFLEMGGNSHNFGTLGMGFHRLSFVLKQNGGSVEAQFYKDGSPSGNHTFSGVASSFAGGSPWVLGAKLNGNSPTNYFTGLVDDLVFYNSLLPLGDIQIAANVGTQVTNPNLYVHFNLNEGLDSLLHDMGTALTGNGVVRGATWSIISAIPQILAHEFTPGSRLVTLNPSNTSADQIDFTDQSTIPVSGYVRFSGTNCFQQKVEILVNGQSHVPQILTDEDGKFTVDVEPGASVVLTPKFEQHTFYPAFWELPKLAAPVAGILFRNQTQRKVVGQIAGGNCRKSVIPDGSIVRVKLATLNGCYEKVIQLDNPNGKFTFNNVPPDSVTVAIIEHSNPIIYNYYQNKGGATLDLKMQNDTIDFIYFAPPQVELTMLDTNACGDPMLNQLQAAQTVVKVFEEYDGGKCYLDSAKLTINNDIADLAQFDTTMTGGSFKYKFKAGGPNIVSPYLKTLQVTAEAHEEQATASLQAVVLGRRARQTTFASTSPEIPTLILRDPPGDASTAYLEKGESTCQTWSYTAAYGANTEINASISLGADLTTSVGLGAEVELEIESTLDRSLTFTTNYNNLTTNESETCVTVNEKISTSDNEFIVGSEMGGDVYMGGAINYIFGITDELKFDTNRCGFVLDKGLMIFPDGFKTTFIYSEYQIKKVVIPNLLAIKDTASATRWQEIIDLNDRLKKEATFSKNLSFDAGAVYEQTETTEVTKTITHEWEVEFTSEFADEYGLEINGIGLGGGIKLAFTTTQSGSSGSSTVNTRSVGYTLADNDIRDNFTVNIKKDKAYGTPVFELVSGQTACPWEPNTQPREEVQISVDKNVAVNINENDVAFFNLTLGNTSQSGENGFYFLELVPESNPDGATLAANGIDLSGPVFYQIAPNKGLNLTATIGRGPQAYNYEDLRIALRSGCEYDRAVWLGLPRDSIDPKFYKEVKVDVHFLEPCSQVDVGFPLQDWVLTPASGNNLNITLSDYDTEDPDLELIRVQYRRSQGDGAWINIDEIPKDSLGDVFTIVPWATSTLMDGLYEIRAVTQCFSGAQNPGISKVVKGKIERSAPEILGTPQPADGVLSAGDEISITFNEPIRCDKLIQADFFSNNNVGLYDAETGNLIDATITCSGDKIVIVPNVPNKFIENKVLRVNINNIEDLVGNTFVQTKWEFFVDRNPVRWVGGNVEVMKYEEDFVTLTRKLENTGGQAVDYEIKGVPAWVRVFPRSGSLAPGVAQNITFEFDSTMVLGMFKDTIYADVALGAEPLVIDARVMCPSPETWTVRPSSYVYSMNMSVQLDIEGVFSADREDIVAAFINGECRGVAKVQYLEPLKKWVAFLTVYSNEFSGEQVKLQIWDASACLLYGQVIESFTFESEDLIGNPQQPQVVRTNNLLLRQIPLNEGWNWISFNLQFPDPSLDQALNSLARPQNDFIKGQTSFSQYFNANNAWVGSLQSLSNLTMYQYRADLADTIDMLGRPINLASTTIPVNAGWNWIGYLPQSALPLNLALASLNPLNGDVIKSQTGFAQYVAGFGWLGNLEYLEAPEGYLLKISNAGTLAYPVPSNLTEAPMEKSKSKAFAANFWSMEPSKFEHTMTLIGMVTADKVNVTAENFELGAFVGDAVRGSAQAIYVKSLNAYLFFITLYANKPGELITFKLHDGTKVRNLKETMYFSSDAQVGLVQDPQPFNLLTTTRTKDLGLIDYFEVTPNPFHNQTTLTFASEQAGEAQFTVLDVMGRTHDQWRVQASAGMNEFRWDAQSPTKGALASGVYFLKLELNGKVTMKKVVLQR